MIQLERRRRLESRSGRYEAMYEIRAFENRVQAMFFEGRVHGTTHTSQGHEAVSVGTAAAARPTDSVTCTYRGHGHALALGMEPSVVLGEIMGRRMGSVGGLGGSMHLCDTAVGLLPTFAIVGAGIPVAAGAALTSQVKGTGDAAIALFGDGAANIGAFHEGLNLAAIWKLPAVFICENNRYGEYTPIEQSTPVEDIAVRAASYGMPGRVVDGQDVEAVAESVGEALDRAREGGGPTLLEMKTYRYAGHSRADPAAYRPEGELEEWQKRDPIDSYRALLIEEGELTAAGADEITARVDRRIAEAEEAAEAAEEATVADMFRHVYAP